MSTTATNPPKGEEVSMAADDSLKMAYGEWLATPEAERIRRGWPRTQAAWAREHGLTPKTATRWKDDPVVLAAIHRAQVPEAEPTSTPEEPLPVDAAEGLARLRGDLLQKGLGGDRDAYNDYMKWFGKDELEAERRAAQAGLNAKTDEELAAEVLDMIGREAIQRWLEGQLAAV